MKKIAIRIENKREFTALTEYMHKKGWKYNPNFTVKGYHLEYCVVEYKDDYLQLPESNLIALRQYEIIGFDIFSRLTGVEVVSKIHIDMSPRISSIQCSVTNNDCTFTFPKSDRTSFVITDKHIEAIYTAFISLQ